MACADIVTKWLMKKPARACFLSLAIGISASGSSQRSSVRSSLFGRTFWWRAGRILNFVFSGQRSFKFKGGGVCMYLWQLSLSLSVGLSVSLSLSPFCSYWRVPWTIGPLRLFSLDFQVGLERGVSL